MKALASTNDHRPPTGPLLPTSSTDLSVKQQAQGQSPSAPPSSSSGIDAGAGGANPNTTTEKPAAAGGLWHTLTATKRRKLGLGILLLCLLGLIIGLAVGIPLSRRGRDGGAGEVHGGDGDGLTAEERWPVKPEIPTSFGWFPSPPGGTSPSWRTSYLKAATLLSSLTLPEKVNITTGTGWMQGPCVGNTGRTSSFPSLCLQDGPLGIRFAFPITVFPAAVTTAATFSRELMYLRGKALGLEARNLGVHALLGPCIGPLGRSPLGGRNWEAFGSDAYLQGVGGRMTVRGVQEMGVVAVAKHWLLNEQERFRRGDEARGQGWGEVRESVSSNIDGRVTREVYAWGWGDVVHEGVGGVMCAYNQVNNSYACQNSWLLNGLLKDELGFQGYVVSDWLAQRTGVESVLAGMDMSMPGDGLVWADGVSLMGSELTMAVMNATIPLSRLDDMVLRIVATYYQMGQDDPSFPKQPLFSSWFRDSEGLTYQGSFDSSAGISKQNFFIDPRDEEHHLLARQIAAEGIVLLKNMNATLPLLPKSKGGVRGVPKEIAIFGTDAGHNPRGANSCADRACNQGTLGQGWGSGSAEYAYLVSPLEAIQARALKDRSALHFVLEDGPTQRVNETAGYVSKRGTDAVCFVFVSADSGEGYVSAEGNIGDRNDLFLWHDGDNMILAVAGRCPNTVVVIHSVGPVIMESWISHPNVKSVLLASLPGQESGTSLVDVIYGDTTPSGKLPYTIGKSLADYGPHAEIMREPNWEVPQQEFPEGLYVDYRWFDKMEIEPRFEFGYGLSYTNFNFSDLRITKVKSLDDVDDGTTGNSPTKPPVIRNSTIPDRSEVDFPENIRSVSRFVYPYIHPTATIGDSKATPYPYPEGYTTAPHKKSPAGGDQGGDPRLWDVIFKVSVLVANTGSLTGKAVVQLYLTFPEGIEIDVPVRQLRGFDKVELKPGENKVVELELTRRDLSVWNGEVQNWVVPRLKKSEKVGRYTVTIGYSSRKEGVKGRTPQV